ncbi:hypothetical protein DFQ26_004035 [Actinomortierella ambigua]|nr:hypothetical protein DFQ26_004035 [Actinomortierella ambigua]
MRHPILDTVLMTTAVTVTYDFNSIIVPFDYLCLPRPPSPPIVRLANSEYHGREYGFPSTHTTTAVAYALYFYGYIARADPEVWPPLVKGLLYVTVALYTFLVAFGRVYCGMHSVTDCVGGAAVGVAIWGVYTYFCETIAFYFTTGFWWSPLAILAIVILSQTCFPIPVEDCPCADDSAICTPITAGWVLGTLHFASMDDYSSNFPEPGTIPYSSEMGPTKSVLRFLLGMATFLVSRVIVKKIAAQVVPPLYQALSGGRGGGLAKRPEEAGPLNTSKTMLSNGQDSVVAVQTSRCKTTETRMGQDPRTRKQTAMLPLVPSPSGSSTEVSSCESSETEVERDNDGLAGSKAGTVLNVLQQYPHAPLHNRARTVTTSYLASVKGNSAAAAAGGRHSSSSSSFSRHSNPSSITSSTRCSTSATTDQSSAFHAGNLEASSCHGQQRGDGDDDDDTFGGRTVNSQPERTMGLGSAILMIIGTLIGTGIFASPGPLFDAVHSTQTSFIIWAFAGLICTIGAYSYAELGTMFPSSGGDFNYLSRAYGRKMGLIFGWTFIMVLNPVGTSGISGVLGRYVVDLIRYFYEAHNMAAAAAVAASGATSSAATGSDFYNPLPIGNAAGSQPPLGISPFNGTGTGGGGGSDYYWSGNETVYGPLIFLNETVGIDDRGHLVHLSPHSPYAPGSSVYNAPFSQPPGADTMAILVRVFSVSAILLMGAINVFFKEGGKYASNFLAILKLAGMSLLIVIGSMAAVKNHAQSEPFLIPIEESSRNVLDYVSALCFAFFAYNGFNNINLGLGELRDPERNLKWAVCLAMPSITVLFLLANFALFSILSSHDLRHIHSLTLHAGHKVLGTPGGYLMAATVIASALGSINANIWAGTRLLVTLANDNELIPACMAKTWSRTGTPAWAMTFLIVQACIHALIGLDFKQFSKVYSAVGWSWYGLSVFGLLYLRKTKPHLPRPVKIWYPLAVLFVAVAAFLVLGALLLAFGSKALLHPSSTTAGGEGDSSGNSGSATDSVVPNTEKSPPVEWGTVGMVIFSTVQEASDL